MKTCRVRRCHGCRRCDNVNADTRMCGRFPDSEYVELAHPTALRLRIDAADLTALQRLQAGIEARIRTVARRDGLAPNWSTSSEQTNDDRRDVEIARSRSRMPHMPLALVLGSAVIAVHLGVAATALSSAAVMGWAAVAGLLLVGLVVITGHAVIGRALLRGAGHVRIHWQRRPPRSQRDSAAAPFERSRRE